MSNIQRAIPRWTWIAPALASALLALKFMHIGPSDLRRLPVGGSNPITLTDPGSAKQARQGRP